ncbi:MAG: hypothetical protein J5798_12615, partial [Spirochaetaceae bacterium]|nr:hypothetical protein [Spirochaetaceae bacterium]
ASSGEAGKNFHIVATEIRRLSDTIIDSIKEIKTVISDVQQASDSLILASEKGTHKIDASCENAKSLERGFGSIMASSQENAGTSEQGVLDAASSDRIFSSIQNIAQGIAEFSHNTSCGNA